MVGYPSPDVVPKAVLLAYIPIGIAMNGAFLGAVFAGTKITYNYISGLESNLEEDILSSIAIGAESGASIGLYIIGSSFFDNLEQVDYTGFPISPVN